VSFVGASQDECTYFFEARSMAACGGVNETEQTLGPGGIFGVMYAQASSDWGSSLTNFRSAMIAAAVYLLGGIAYQRTVMHQRGWKQLPNYSTWAGIGNFLNVRKSFSVWTANQASLQKPTISHF
jgi:cation-dependent mannose-6-phosphate receptor